MNFRALFLAVVGAFVAVFYAFELFLHFQANDFSAVLLVKALICVSGAYVFWRNVKRVKQHGSDNSHVDAD